MRHHQDGKESVASIRSLRACLNLRPPCLQLYLTDRVRELESLLADASQQEVCDVMEGRLVKLSGLVRAKEDENTALRQQLEVNCSTVRLLSLLDMSAS